MENYFDKKFELRYFEMNEFGEASPTTILTLLEETAADHCYSIDYDLYDLIDQNIGWVLVSGVMNMERYPNYKEKITIRTWLSSYSTVRGIRENIIYDEQNNIIGTAKGLWIFFDIKRRRPVEIFDEIKNSWSSCKEESVKYNVVKKIAAIDTAKFMKDFDVNKFDVDMNEHVSNLRYLQWSLESVPDEIIENYYLHTLEGRFIGEAHYGDSIRSLTESDVDKNSFVHTIKAQSNNQVFVTAKTIWKKRLN
ncbi:MAG: acyl-ACP thioesterase [Flavobacteriaceae bacterium]|nr:acyl-ACP thioesterase [Flavobacteriaceae bacterium]